MPSRERNPWRARLARLRFGPASHTSTWRRHRPSMSAAERPAGPPPAIRTSHARRGGIRVGCYQPPGPGSQPPVRVNSRWSREKTRRRGANAGRPRTPSGRGPPPRDGSRRSGTPRADDAPGCDARATDISTWTRSCRPLDSRVTSGGVEARRMPLGAPARPVERWLRGRGVPILDELLDPLPGVPGVAAGSLDFRDLVGESLVPDGVTHPARVVARAEVVQPRLVVDALGELEEHLQVLRAQVQLSRGAAEVEALVGPQLACRVLADVALALALGSGRRGRRTAAPRRARSTARPPRSRGRPRPRAAAPGPWPRRSCAASLPRPVRSRPRCRSSAAPAAPPCSGAR